MTMYTPDFRAVMRAGDGPIPDEVLVHARRLVNEAVRGHLELHYDTRTVRLNDLDGDAALRLMKVVADYDPEDPTSRRWSQDCDPRSANAFDGWVQFDPERLLGSRWSPHRFTPGETEHRRVVYAAFRLAQAGPDPAEIDTWGPALWRDYLIVSHDYSADSEETELSEPDTPDGLDDFGDGCRESDRAPEGRREGTDMEREGDEPDTEEPGNTE